MHESHTHVHLMHITDMIQLCTHVNLPVATCPLSLRIGFIDDQG